MSADLLAYLETALRAEAAARESWRQLLLGVVAPLAGIVSDELTRKLEAPMSFVFEDLRASDLPAGRGHFKAWWAAA